MSEQPSGASEDRADVLVFQDSAGNYYALSARQLEEHRVPDDKKAEIDQRLQGADVVGYGGQTRAAISRLPAGIAVRGSFSSPVHQLPVLPRALMQGPPTAPSTRR